MMNKLYILLIWAIAEQLCLLSAWLNKQAEKLYLYGDKKAGIK